MKKALLIFDRYLNKDRFFLYLNTDRFDKIDLFPLTSDWEMIKTVETACKNKRGESGVNVLESSKLINEEVKKFRYGVSRWSADLGNHKAGNKTIKEWLLTPKREVSTWWFSLTSEKNTLKTDAFFRVAQTNALNGVFIKEKYDLCYISVADKKMHTVIKKISKRYGVSARLINSKDTNSNVDNKIYQVKRYLEGAGFFGDIVHALLWFARSFYRGINARRVMGSMSSRLSRKDSTLFVSYYPLVDREAAKHGMFKNKYGIPLQNKLKQLGKPIIWLFMYEDNVTSSYSSSVKLARTFKNPDEAFFFIEEFISIKVAAAALYSWLIQVIKYLFLFLKLNPEFLYGKTAVSETDVFLKPVWRQSIVGKRGIEGIVYFETFKKIFDFFSGSGDCIYYTEMHAWEKALNAAKKTMAKETRTIGFQHVSLARNFFHYFHDMGETKKKGEPSDLPLPDILACNGVIPCEIMAERGYSNLTTVEAVRQLYLSKYLRDKSHTKNDPPVLLVAGSIDRTETASIVSLLSAAFDGNQDCRIWLKGHPNMPMEEILSELHIDYDRRRYEIKHSPIGDLLKEATIVIVGASTVALEALAFDCQVIVPVLSDQMFLSPLEGFESYYHKIYTPDDLRNTVNDLLHENDNRNGDARDFISKYWNLDESLSEWERVLKE